MIRRFLPRSLMGQLLLVVGAALCVAQIVNFTWLARGARDAREGEMSAAAASLLANAADRLAQGMPLPGAGRGEAVEVALQVTDRSRGPRDPRQARRRRITVGAAPDFALGMTDRPDIATRVTALLVDSDAGFTAVRAATAPVAPGRFQPPNARRELVMVAARLPDSRWITVRARVMRPGARLFLPIIGQTLILLALLLAALWWATRRVAEPLARLTAAAQAQQPGAAAEIIAEAGPEDVRALTRAFNGYTDRIRAMLADKDHMLGAMGHDLRTPLASLRVRAEQVADPALRDAMAGTITDMATMLDDIVALARAGQSGETPVLTDVAAMVASLVDDYRAMDRPVSLAPDGAVVSVPMRAGGVRRALRNLIDNAVKYGERAVVSVAREGGALRISVADAGPGIPPDQVEAMLRPFVRAEASRNRETGGAGLGLALARAVAEQEGGRLTLINAPAGGLVASLWLPDGASSVVADTQT